MLFLVMINSNVECYLVVMYFYVFCNCNVNFFYLGWLVGCLRRFGDRDVFVGV